MKGFIVVTDALYALPRQYQLYIQTLLHDTTFRSNTIVWEKKKHSIERNSKVSKVALDFFSPPKSETTTSRPMKGGKFPEVSSRARLRKVIFSPNSCMSLFVYLSVHPSIQKKNESTWDKILTTGDIILGEVHIHYIG